MKRSQIIAVLAILALTVVAVGIAVAAPAKRVANLTSSSDSNAKGRAVLRVNPAERRICFRITFEGTNMNPTYGGIDRGGPSREHAVQLFNNDNGPHSSPIEGCARELERRLVHEIKEHPRRFWVNLFQYGTDNELRGRIHRP